MKILFILYFAYLLSFGCFQTGYVAAFSCHSLPIRDGVRSESGFTQIHIDTTDLLDFGGVGVTTGAVPEVLVSNFQGANARFIFTVNDVYDLFFTYSDGQGGRCNATTQTDTPKSIPEVQIVQPRCMFTNASITVLQTDKLDGSYYTIYPSINIPESYFSLKSTNATFQYRVQIDGQYTVKFGDSDTQIDFPLSPQSELFPLTSFSEYIFGQPNITFSVFNSEYFASIRIVDQNGNIIAPIRPNIYSVPIENNFKLYAESNTCGSQEMDIYSTANPLIICTIHGFDCTAGTANVSFNFESNQTVINDQFYITLDGRPYNLGDQVVAPFRGDINVDFFGVNSDSIVYTIPSPSGALGYTVNTYPTCSTNGSVTFNYNGNISDYSVNNVKLTSKTMLIEYNKYYSVQPICGGVQTLAINKVEPLFSFISTSSDCLGYATIVIQNYEMFSDLTIFDSNLYITYNHTNGVFTQVFPAYVLVINYFDVGCHLPRQSFIRMPMQSIDTSTLVVTQSSDQPGDSCDAEFSVSFNITNKGVHIQNITIPSAQVGDLITKQFTFGNCPFFDVDLYVDQINSTTYRTITPAACADSYALIQLESVNLVDLGTLYVNGQSIYINRDNGTYWLPVGQHVIQAQYYGRCYDTLVVDIVPKSNRVLDHTVTQQDSTHCGTASGAIQFSTPGNYSMLKIDGTSATNGLFSNLASFTYSVDFDHSVCGLGRMLVPVTTDGQVQTDLVYQPTCMFEDTDGDGVLHVKVLNKLGNQLSVGSRGKFIPSMGLFFNQPYGNYTYQIFSDDYCAWNISGEMKQNEVDISFYNIRFPQTGAGSFNFNVSTDIFINGVGAESGGIFIRPNYLGGAIFPYSNSMNIQYNDYCYLNKPLPVADDDINIFNLIELVPSCESMSPKIYFPKSITDMYYVLTSTGALDANNQAYVTSYMAVGLTNKQTGKLSIIQLPFYSNTLYVPNTDVAMTNETCMGGGDGSITLTNPIPGLEYFLTDMVDTTYPQPINGVWSNLTAKSYTIRTLNSTQRACTGTIDVTLQSDQPVIKTKSVNKCSASTNGKVNLSTFLKGQLIDNANVVYSINETSSTSQQTLQPNNYVAKAFVNQGTCRQFVTQPFEIKSNIIGNIVDSSACGTVGVVATSELSDTLSINLMKADTLIKSVTGNQASFTNIQGGTYQVIITESSGCSITTSAFKVTECPVTSSEGSETEPSQSNHLTPSAFIFLLLSILSIFLL